MIQDNIETIILRNVVLRNWGNMKLVWRLQWLEWIQMLQPTAKAAVQLLGIRMQTTISLTIPSSTVHVTTLELLIYDVLDCSMSQADTTLSPTPLQEARPLQSFCAHKIC